MQGLYRVYTGFIQGLYRVYTDFIQGYYGTISYHRRPRQSEANITNWETVSNFLILLRNCELVSHGCAPVY